MSTTVDAVDESTPVPPARATTRTGSGWFRAFWRWHFYASFLVIPFLFMLAVTGLIYLLRFEIEPLMNRDTMTVDAPADPAAIQQPYAIQQTSVEEAFPGATVLSMAEPRSEGRATAFSVEMPDGSSRDVFVDPWTADVQGVINPDTTLSGYAIRIHGDLMVGTWGDYAIELATCWAIVMAITGYLIFVKGRKGRLRRLAAKSTGAVLRHRHGWIGAVAGVGLLLLLITGLPWTAFWGAKVQEAATDRGTSLWSEDPGAMSHGTSTLDESLPHSHKVEVPWGLGKTDVPKSSKTDEISVANLDTAVVVGERAGLARPMTVSLPGDDTGVYSAIGYAFNDPGKERTVHVDQYSGEVIYTYGYADYPKLAKAVSQGIALHEGRRFGTANFWGTIAFCVAVIFLCLSGPIMWWRRRPAGSGSIGAPRGALPIRGTWWVLALLVALGLFLPLFGLSLLVILLLDQVLLRRVPLLRDWFNVSAR